VTRLGRAVATQVLPVHGVDRHGQGVIRPQLSRGTRRGGFAQRPACRIGLEAWARAPSWAREWSPCGHTVRLLAPQCVRPYRQHPQPDGSEAEAICEAGSRAWAPSGSAGRSICARGCSKAPAASGRGARGAQSPGGPPTIGEASGEHGGPPPLAGMRAVMAHRSDRRGQRLITPPA
jgi:hypothetical protein